MLSDLQSKHMLYLNYMTIRSTINGIGDEKRKIKNYLEFYKSYNFKK